MKVRSEFHKAGSSLRPECRQCAAVYHAAHYQSQRKQRLARQVAYNAQLHAAAVACVGDRCAVCNTMTDLEIDHVNGGRKAERSQYGGNQGWYRALINGVAPTKHLQVLCADCHRQKTAIETGRYKRKLTHMEVCLVRIWCHSYTQSEVAETFGVSRATISNIVQRAFYGDITDLPAIAPWCPAVVEVAS